MRRLLAVVAVFALGMLLSSPAQAKRIEACGGANISNSSKCAAECANCQAHCSPASTFAWCATRLYQSCQPKCGIIAASCDVGCQADCEAVAQASGQLDCESHCTLSSAMGCFSHCSTAANRQQCEQSCKATWGGECQRTCNALEANAPLADRCKAACDGTCSAKANLDCQSACQEQSLGQCPNEVIAECQTQCASQGAIFCDGQVLDLKQGLEKCQDALHAELNIELENNAGNGNCAGTSGVNAEDETDSSRPAGDTGCACHAAHSKSASYTFPIFGVCMALSFARKKPPPKRFVA